MDALAPLIETTKARPKMLDGTHAGDCGFDPAGFCKDDELLYFYLESEVTTCFPEDETSESILS